MINSIQSGIIIEEVKVIMNTILFDLDGTLVPITQKDFGNVYFKLLISKNNDLNISIDTMKTALFSGVKAMVKNDGSVTNEQAFWNAFTSVADVSRKDCEIVFEKFYATEFDKVKSVVTETDISKQLISVLKQKGYKLILATNPIFPIEAVEKRLKWVGLSKSDFAYITTYDNSCFCKPNPLYFKEIVDKLGLDVNECLMVGNNVVEDTCAEKIGIKTILLTDTLENENNLSLSAWEHYSQKDFLEKAKSFD